MSANLKKWLTYAAYALVGYILYRIISNRLEAPKTPSIPIVTANGSTLPVVTKFVYNVATVDRKRFFGLGTNNSQEVGYLQVWLNTHYAAGLIVDGDFGAKTAARLQLAKPTANPVSTNLDTLAI